MKRKSLGQIAFETFWNPLHKREYKWESTSESTKKHWSKVASAVALEVKKRMRGKK